MCPEPHVTPENPPTLTGRRLEFSPGEDEARAQSIEWAFDYRGDVTLELADGSKVEGYVFDRDAERAVLRILPADGSGRRTIAWRDLRALVFSGKDAAAGKSWEAWVRRYAEQKRAELRAARGPGEAGEDPESRG